MQRRTLLVGTAAVISGAAIGSMTPLRINSTAALSVLSGPTMGTYFRIAFPKADASPADIKADALTTLSQVDALMSTYRADSEVSRFNRYLSSAPMRISDSTRDVIDRALQIGDFTGGAFDITTGPLVELWGFGPAGSRTDIPAQTDINNLARGIGYKTLELNNRNLRKTDQKVGVDLSGIAKGYAVDRLAQMLEERGISAYLVDVGGELRAKDRRPDGDSWRVGIELPVAGERRPHRVVNLRDRAIATSGDYRNFFMHHGDYYTHIIDPRTSQPVSHGLASVTVLERDAMTADALSTALMVMGPDQGRRFAEENGLAAYFIWREHEMLFHDNTTAFEPLLI